MARENVQGSIITTKGLISDHSGYMPPFLLSTAQKLHLIKAAGRKPHFKMRFEFLFI